MPRCRAVSAILLVCGVAIAAALGGCSASPQVIDDKNEGGWFSKPLNVFHKPDWATRHQQKPDRLTRAQRAGGPGGLGRRRWPLRAAGCGSHAANGGNACSGRRTGARCRRTGIAEPPADRPVGSIAGDLAGPPMPQAPPPPPAPAKPIAVASANPEALEGLQPGGPSLTGGVALGMTECDAVRRAGQPNDVNIGADAKGERKVVLTYLSGTRPGIYTFAAGRLKQIARAPGQPAPEKPTRKRAKRKPAHDKTAAQPGATVVYAQ